MTDLAVRFPVRPACVLGGYGLGQQQMRSLVSGVCDREGRLYVLDDVNCRVMRYGRSGQHLGNWWFRAPVDPLTGMDEPLVDKGPFPQRLAVLAADGDLLYFSDGEQLWQRNLASGAIAHSVLEEKVPHPRAMAVGVDGRIYLTARDVLVRAFAPDGRMVGDFCPVRVARPDGVALVADARGCVWVALRRHQQVLCLDAHGRLVNSLNTRSTSGRIAGLAIDGDDRVWVRSDRQPRLDLYSRLREHLGTLAIMDPMGLPVGRGFVVWNETTQTLVDVDGENFSIKLWPLGVDVTETEVRFRPSPEHPARLCPDHVTLKWTGDPRTGVTVTWRTAPGVEGAQAEFGEIGAEGSMVLEGMSQEGSSELLSTNLGPIVMHRVELAKLEAGRSYGYRVGDGRQGRWSPWRSFTTAPEEGPIKFGVMGEIHMGGLPHEAVSAAMVREKPDFILNTGDIVSRGANQVHWDEWSRWVGELTATAPHMVAMGNHDTHRGVVSQYYRARFGVPRVQGCPGLEGFAYSFDYANLHVVILSTTHPIDLQMRWLQQDLAANRRMWTVVAMHVPPYTSKAEREKNHFRGTVVPLFEEYGVDLVFAGHDKAYMRTFPMLKEQPLSSDATAPRYITVVSGDGFYPIADFPWIDTAHAGTTMYGVVEIEGNQLQFEAKTPDGRVIDQLQLKKR